MRFDDYSPMVVEIIQFFSLGKVLSTPNPDSAVECFRVDQFSIAKQMAREDIYSPERMLWSDIRENEHAKILKTAYAAEGYKEIESKLWDAFKFGVKRIGTGLGGTLFSDILDEVSADYNGCLYSRTFLGRSSIFFEKIFSAYQSGGWPCGWKGDYPHGVIAVYFPS